MKEIIDLFNQGHGSAAIALKLKIKPAIVRKVLKDNNLKRTPEEARLAKMKAEPVLESGNIPSIPDIKKALYKHSDIQGAARALGMSAKLLIKLMDDYEIEF